LRGAAVVIAGRNPARKTKRGEENLSGVTRAAMFGVRVYGMR
jgi:hypothetical protein